MENNKRKKLSTGIKGLDDLFYGGIHTHKGEDGQNGILMLARGQHGVNKIHLAMQICEGLYDSSILPIDRFSDAIEKYKFSFLYKRENDDNRIIKLAKEKINGKIESLEKEEQQKKEKRKWEERKKKLDNPNNDWFKEYGSRVLRDNVLELHPQKTDDLKDLKEVLSLKDDKDKIDDVLDSVFSKVILKYQDEWNEKDIELKGIDKLYEENRGNNPKVLFVSLNKDYNLLKNSYYDFYIQRLIRSIREGKDENEVEISLCLLHSMPWIEDSCDEHLWDGKKLVESYELPSITGKITNPEGVNLFKKHIESGFIYYNGRTHGLHIRHQKGAKDTGDMLLCKLYVPDEYNRVRIVGKDNLNEGSNKSGGLTTFQNMMRLLDKYEKGDFDYIMIDGLSRLTKEEIAQCPFNALSDKLRSMCIVGIVTADEKLLQSDINVDIVLDMAIRESDRPDHLYTAIKISKCLYQKNTYGWHRYKMRNAGIEVIPSIHYQMVQRFLMDDVVTDAVRPINEFPYPYWLNENKTIYEDKTDDAKEDKKWINDAIDKDFKDNSTVEPKGVLHGVLLNLLSDLFTSDFLATIEDQHVFFVSFDKNRSEFYDEYKVLQDRFGLDSKKVHMYNFQPGYSHADEFLWALHRQIQAIEKIARKDNTESNNNVLETHFTHVITIIGDLNFIHYAYPCLSAEQLLLPAIATYTKKHHMTNYLYATLNKQGIETINTELYKKELETIMQMRRLTKFVNVTCTN